MKILIVDDSKSTCKAMVLLLKKMGYKHTESVDCGEDALKKCVNPDTCPNVIFLDVLMAGISGLDTLATLRKQGFKGIINMLTGINDAGTMAFCLENGADSYLVKSTLNPDTLRHHIKHRGI